MAEEQKLHKLEHLKESSQQLRGSLPEELSSDSDHLSEEGKQILKFHGMYQQDDRDLRKAKNPDGSRKGKTWIFMVRTRIPGGKVPAEALLSELDICEKYGNGTLRITTRQGFQLHGIVKDALKETVRGINETTLTTLGACGDNERNVMCCPAPYKNNKVRDQMQEMADRVADHLKLPTAAYNQIWLKDENGESHKVSEIKPTEKEDHPIYGPRMLPRKFKTAFALPEDNCVDIYSNDLGFLAIVENDEVVGYNVLVGGGMGVTPSAKKTFPAVAKKMAFVKPEQVVDVAEAVVKVQRDFGNRADRKVARMKYLIAEWGLAAFKAKVEEYYGASLPEPRPEDVYDLDDHVGWHEQGDGRWFLGLNIENGRIKDEGEMRLKSGLRAVVDKYRMPTRTTPKQGLILCDIEPDWKADIDRILQDHGVRQAEDYSLTRRYSMACPALPTCGLSITESERVMPALMDGIEAEMAKYGLSNERIAVHMTGCPNGCARPYTPDIGIVGRSVGKYTIFLGGNVTGTRLAFKYKDVVPLEEIPQLLSPLFAYYKTERTEDESFGDFCCRKGQEDLEAYAEEMTEMAASQA